MITDTTARGGLCAVRRYPFEIALAAWSMWYGVLVALDRGLHGAPFIGALDTLPLPLAAVMAGLFFVGGGAIITALIRPQQDLGTVLAMERVGLLLITGAWVAYGASTLAKDSADVTAWSSAIAVALASIVRWQDLGTSTRRIRAAVRQRA